MRSRARGQLRAKEPLRARLQARSKPKDKDKDREKANRKVRVKVRRPARERPANPPPKRDRGAAKAKLSQDSLAKANPRGKGRAGVKDKVSPARERVKGVALMARPVAGIASRVDAGVQRLP